MTTNGASAGFRPEIFAVTLKARVVVRPTCATNMASARCWDRSFSHSLSVLETCSIGGPNGFVNDKALSRKSPGRPPRVKLGRNLAHLEHSNRRRQNVVQGFQKIFRWDRRPGRKRTHLCQCMHPGIGSPRPLRQDIFAGQSSNSRGECALDRRRVRLQLPAGEICAIVGQRQSEIAPHFCSESSVEIASSNRSFTKFYPFWGPASLETVRRSAILRNLLGTQ